MTTMTFSVQIIGPVDEEDREVMVKRIDEENARRTTLNNAVPPPIPLLTILPKDTAAERKTSAEIIATARQTQVHLKDIKQLNEETVATSKRFRDLAAFFRRADETTKEAIEAALGAPIQ